MLPGTVPVYRFREGGPFDLSFVRRCGIFLGSRAHLTNLGAGGGAEVRLTCLSVRCLSSYLFFRQFQ